LCVIIVVLLSYISRHIVSMCWRVTHIFTDVIAPHAKSAESESARNYHYWFPFHATFFWDTVCNLYITYVRHISL